MPGAQGLTARTLVIGYGNDLRTDDGAGRRVADEVERHGLPGVEVRSVAQLTPELALEIAGTQLVVFVDASVDTTRVTAADVIPGRLGPGIMSHHGDPGALLALTATVGEVPERAVVISIPARDLGLGTELSPGTRSGVATAVEMVVALVAGVGHQSSGPA